MKKQIVAIIATVTVTAVVLLGGIYAGMSLTGIGNAPTDNAEMIRAAVSDALIAFDTPTTATEENAQTEQLPQEILDTIAIPGYAQIIMQEGNLIQRIELNNPVENPCYFVISIIMPDETEVFRSGLIEPGQKTDAIQLKQALTAGTYDNAIMRYSCYTLDGQAPMNGADINFTLEVV